MYDDYNDFKKEAEEPSNEAFNNNVYGGMNNSISYSSYESSQQKNNMFRDEPKKKGGFVKFVSASLVGAILGSVITGAGFFMIYGDMSKNSTGKDKDTKVEIVNKTDNAISAVAKKAGPSTVGIEVTAKVSDFFFGEQNKTGTGSGVIIRANGYVMTNYHVIQEALDSRGAQSAQSTVKVYFSEDKILEAKIIGYDERTDLAVIKVEEKNLPAIEFADSDKIQVGDQVIAIGNPGGLELAGSITAGVVSGLNRKVGENNDEIKLIQTDASINPGNSGGALVNLEGKLVGVNSSKIASVEFEGIGFAIPSNDAYRVCESLIENKYVKGRPRIGIEINPNYTAEFARQMNYPEGLYVSSVSPFSGAEAAGIKVSDIITEFNGVRTKEFNDLEEAKNKLKPGQTVKVKIFREGKYLTLDLTLTEDKNIR